MVLPIKRASVTIYEIIGNSKERINALVASVSAGEPITVSSDIERIDANSLITRGSDSCLLVRVNGESMATEIVSGDWVVIDRLRQPQPNDIVLASVNGEFTIKKHKLNDGCKQGLYLVPANTLYQTRKVNEDDNFSVVGVVVTIIHSMV